MATYLLLTDHTIGGHYFPANVQRHDDMVAVRQTQVRDLDAKINELNQQLLKLMTEYRETRVKYDNLIASHNALKAKFRIA